MSALCAMYATRAASFRGRPVRRQDHLVQPVPVVDACSAANSLQLWSFNALLGPMSRNNGRMVFERVGEQPQQEQYYGQMQ